MAVMTDMRTVIGVREMTMVRTTMVTIGAIAAIRRILKTQSVVRVERAAAAAKAPELRAKDQVFVPGVITLFPRPTLRRLLSISYRLLCSEQTAISNTFSDYALAVLDTLCTAEALTTLTLSSLICGKHRWDD